MNESTFQLGRFFKLVKQTLTNKKKTFVVTLMIVGTLPLLVLFLTQVAASPHNCVKLQLKASLFHLVFNSNCS